jgi:hypothetical protein
MPSLTFFRGNYTEMWLVITADEPLSPLGGGYIEDYFGTPSQVSLRDVSDNTRYTILITDTNSQSLSGYINTSSIPDGTFAIEGRIQDTVGHNTIIGDYFDSLVTGPVIEAFITIFPEGEVTIGATFDTTFQSSGLNFRLAIIKDILFSEDVSVSTGMQQSNYYFDGTLLNDVNLVSGMQQSNYYFHAELLEKIDPIL